MFDLEDDMQLGPLNSEVMESDGTPRNGTNRSRGRPRVRLLGLVAWLRRLVSGVDALDSDYDPALEKERLLGKALTRGEQEAYERAVSIEREIHQSAVQLSRESLDRTHRDLKTAAGIILDSSVREAQRLGHIFYETRRAREPKLAVVQ